MRIVEITKPFTRNDVKFEATHKYVLPEDVEQQIRIVHKDAVGPSYPLEMSYKPYKGEDLTGKKLMCWRTGGIGDLYFLSPVLSYIKEKYKNVFLRVASGCKQPLENLPEIDELYSVPFDAKLLDDMDYHLIFQGILETSSEKSKKKHAVDMFFDYFSIDSTQFPREKKIPKLVFTSKEMEWLKAKLADLKIAPEDYVVGIQMESSAQLRNFPQGKMKSIIQTLATEKDTKIMLVGSADHTLLGNFYRDNKPNITVATNFSVRESIVLANRYDVILAPDSFLIHTAGALRKPLVGLYGPFDSALRMAYFDNAIALESNVPCSPCFVHDAEPCIKGFPSPCFTLVRTEDVLQALDYQRFKFQGTHFVYSKYFLNAPNLSEIQQYIMSADKGLCFFGGYFKHPNMIHVETNMFTKPDKSNLSEEFPRNFYPFVLYMEDFNPKRMATFHGSKTMVRSGGYFIIYKSNASDQFITEVMRDIGKDFVILHSKMDPATRQYTLVAKKSY